MSLLSSANAMTGEYRIVHYVVTQKGDSIVVPDCFTAFSDANDNGWATNEWSIEVFHYDKAGEAVAGGEWSCDCGEVPL